LNVGGNVFDVASPDAKRGSPVKPAQPDMDMDPIAQALEELKGVTKASSVRVSADRYAGLATPAPPGTPGGTSSPLPGAVRTPLAHGGHSAPPPSYDQPVSRLGAPPAAHTSRAMQETTKKYTAQKQEMFNSSPSHQRGQSYSNGGASYNRPSTRQGQDQMRSSSPAPPRATSPRPDIYGQHQQQSYNQQPSQSGHGNRPPSQAGYGNRPPSQAGYNNRAVSPNPYQQQQPPPQQARPRANTNYATRGGSPATNMQRAASPQPQFAASQSRPGSRAGAPMAMALASPVSGSEYGTQRGRPQSQYYAGSNAGSAAGNEVGRVRSKSMAEPKQFTRDGKAIIHYARAMYMYQAQIPEELGFSKGDVLAVIRHQDDGWWEAEIPGKPSSGRGLVPSNYLVAC